MVSGNRFWVPSLVVDFELLGVGFGTLGVEFKLLGVNVGHLGVNFRPLEVDFRLHGEFWATRIHF